MRGDPDSADSVLIISVRNLRKHAANSLLYEFEDLAQIFHSATVHAPKTEHKVSRKLYRTIKRLSNSNAMAQKGSRFPTLDLLTDAHKLILVVADNPYQLHLLNHVAGWRDHPAKKACYLTEVWPGSLEDKFVQREPFEDYDHVFVGFTNAVPLLKDKLGVSCSFLPVGVDTDVFSHQADSIERPIDIAYVGRRVDPIHKALLHARDDKDLFYLYDTSSGLMVDNPVDHRKMYADTLRRSKCAIAFPAKMDLGGYTNNAIEIGWRYYEFAAAGVVTLGASPKNDRFEELFGWENSVIDVDESSLNKTLLSLINDSDYRHDISVRNIKKSKLRHDWVYRWIEILKQFSLQPSKRALNRVERLQTEANELS